MANLTDSIKYLDFTGLQTYDALIKARIAAGDDAVALQITNLIGTLAQDDAATIEAINDELNGLTTEVNRVSNLIESKNDGISSKLSALTTKVSTLESSINSLTMKVNALETRVNTLHPTN